MEGCVLACHGSWSLSLPGSTSLLLEPPFLLLPGLVTLTSPPMLTSLP